jgi:hypothetical protein
VPPAFQLPVAAELIAAACAGCAKRGRIAKANTVIARKPFDAPFILSPSASSGQVFVEG